LNWTSGESAVKFTFDFWKNMFLYKSQMYDLPKDKESFLGIGGPTTLLYHVAIRNDCLNQDILYLLRSLYKKLRE
jgi:hypothetical protein